MTSPRDLITQAGPEIWAILPAALMARMAESDAPPTVLDEVAISRPGPKSGRLLSVPVRGVISRRDSFWSALFGGSSIERLTTVLREAAADPNVSTVLLDVDSPGGTISGLTELAAEVRTLRESKRVVALANSLMASAAYWLSSQADEIVAAPDALVGSIGVFATHADYSKFYADAGVKVSYIYAGKYKVEGNPMEPLADEARAHMQSLVDDGYRLFVGDVAKGRGVAASVVREQYGEGRVLSAADAKTAGLIDRIATFDETIRRLAGARSNEGTRLALSKRRLDLADKTFEEE